VNPLPFLIVTGLSGSGKSTALAALEDVGFFCVDNMPVALLPAFLELAPPNGAETNGMAFGMDLREKGFIADYDRVLGGLREQGFGCELLFLEASERVLVQRFSATRRQHPLARGQGLLAGIRRERQLLEDLRTAADHVIDTTLLNVHELKQKVMRIVAAHRPLEPLQVHVISFGFKHGLPPEADMVIDVRFLLNPFFVPELKALDGEDAEIREFVLKTPEASLFMAKVADLIDFLLPLYEKEGKTQLSIAVGCTGGRHRSVVIARALYDHIAGRSHRAELIHRDIHQPQ
jgi:RNase adapter protein RapZ